MLWEKEKEGREKEGMSVSNVKRKAGVDKRYWQMQLEFVLLRDNNSDRFSA